MDPRGNYDGRMYPVRQRCAAGAGSSAGRQTSHAPGGVLSRQPLDTRIARRVGHLTVPALATRRTDNRPPIPYPVHLSPQQGSLDMPDLVRVQRALISVSDKTGL